MLKTTAVALVAFVVLAGCTFGPDPYLNVGKGPSSDSGGTVSANTTGAPGAPTVMLQASPSRGTAPLVVVFKLQAEASNTTAWTLALGDGSAPVEGVGLPASLEHRYDVVGDFRVVLKVTQGDLTSEAAVTIQVVKEPETPSSSTTSSSSSTRTFTRPPPTSSSTSSSTSASTTTSSSSTTSTSASNTTSTSGTNSTSSSSSSSSTSDTNTTTSSSSTTTTSDTSSTSSTTSDTSSSTSDTSSTTTTSETTTSTSETTTSTSETSSSTTTTPPGNGTV